MDPTSLDNPTVGTMEGRMNSRSSPHKSNRSRERAHDVHAKIFTSAAVAIS